MKKYIRAEMEVVEFEVADVIATSGDACEYKNAGSFDGEWVKIGCN
ncbi:MAG: hypothetical protein J6C41_06820 [Oscillospiraceae bacterium]|nr:hypothetical protein [Oscillospiraceae bacterium]